METSHPGAFFLLPPPALGDWGPQGYPRLAWGIGALPAGQGEAAGPGAGLTPAGGKQWDIDGSICLPGLQGAGGKGGSGASGRGTPGQGACQAAARVRQSGLAPRDSSEGERRDGGIRPPFLPKFSSPITARSRSPPGARGEQSYGNTSR